MTEMSFREELAPPAASNCSKALNMAPATWFAGYDRLPVPNVAKAIELRPFASLRIASTSFLSFCKRRREQVHDVLD